MGNSARAKTGFCGRVRTCARQTVLICSIYWPHPIITINVFLMLLRSPMSVFRWLSAICCLGIVLFAQAAQSATVNGVRVWRAPDHTRIVLDLDAPVQHSLTLSGNPDRII